VYQVQGLVIAGIAAAALAVSAVFDLKKTGAALRLAARRFVTLMPAFAMMLTVVSLVFAFVSRETIVHYLGQEQLAGATALAAALGSIFLMPGFIAFPLAGILVQNGVARMVVAAFTTTLMMVGVLTYPVEKKYFGMKVTVMRNLLSLAIAVAVSVVIGLCFKEVGR